MPVCLYWLGLMLKLAYSIEDELSVVLAIFGGLVGVLASEDGFGLLWLKEDLSVFEPCVNGAEFEEEFDDDKLRLVVDERVGVNRSKLFLFFLLGVTLTFLLAASFVSSESLGLSFGSLLSICFLS